jgi:hypothetical protein
MVQGLFIALGWALIGFLAGLLTLYFLIKYKVEIVRGIGDRLVLELPIIGRIKTRFRVKYSGMFVDEWSQLRDKIEELSHLLDPEFVFYYAKEFGVRYIGFEGDRDDKTWTPGRLAYSALSHGVSGDYNVFLNPSLDIEDVGRRLSLEIGEVIYPSEVQTFLFLHEIGHTRKAGNDCYFTAVVNYSLSGGKHSMKRRSELIHLKRRIEVFADQFALRELKKWRRKIPKEMAQY